jgi:MoaA/NifB/PqqE/SkfB family radical SAM enzyme
MADYNFKLGNSRNQTFTEIWNSQRMKELRVSMINDQQHSACDKCYNIENSGGTSMRQNMNTQFSHKFTNVDTTHPDGTVDKVDMTYMDIRFSNICNFKCRSCGPTFSSQWKDEWEQLYTGGTWPRVTRVKNTLAEVWEDIETWIDTVEQIYFAGGEPLIMDEHYKILEYLIANNKTDIGISYNTNMSTLVYKKHNVIDLWKHFKNIRIDASLDGYGKHAEYIRAGTDWNQVEKNIEYVRSNCVNITFSISCTVSVYNAFHITDFFKYCIDKKFVDYPDNITINIVQFPELLNTQVLPMHLKNQVIEKVNKYIHNDMPTYKSSVLKNNLDMYKHYLLERNINKFDEFIGWTAKLDGIRNENVDNILPEIKALTDDR